jgi:hypothetical protein
MKPCGALSINAPMKTTKYLLVACLVFACWQQVACQEKKVPSVEQPHREVISKFEPFPADPGKTESDFWYSIWMQGKPAGWMHEIISLHDTPFGQRRKSVVETKLLLMIEENRVEDNSIEAILETIDGQVVRIREVEKDEDGHETVVEAGKIGDQMVCIRGPEIKKVAFDYKALDDDAYQHLLAGRQLKVKDKLSFSTFSTEQAKYVEAQIEIKEVSETKPVYFLINQTSAALPGLNVDVKLNSSFEPVELFLKYGILELNFRRQSKKPDLTRLSSFVDLDRFMKVEVDFRFKQPENVHLARYRISGVPDFVKDEWLQGPGQKVISRPAKSVFVIENQLLEKKGKTLQFPIKVEDPKLKFWLASTAMSRLDDPLIVSTAKEVTGDEKDAWLAAKKLRHYVSTMIETSRDKGFLSASEVLRQKRGDCSEMSVLLATLARAVGIPARSVYGLVYSDGSFGRHMWTEVWVGQWRPLDAAFNTDKISAAWIRLGEESFQFSDDKQHGLGGKAIFAADIKISLLDSKIKTLNND